MKKTDWNRLRELALDRRNIVGQRLAEAAKLRDAARQKLEMLLDYRQDYDGRLAESTGGGIDAGKLRSYRAFLASLERAIEQQTETLAAAQQPVTGAEVQWRDEQRQVDAFSLLNQRHQVERARSVGRIEQKLTDEFASRALAAGVAD